MATSTSVLCGVCDARHVTKCADHWCPECEEGLCSDCQEHHSLSKGTRKHKIIPIENFQNLPNFVVDISDNCKEHDMKFTNYCPQHDKICCPTCLTTEHQKCDQLRTLPDIIQNAKHSALISMLDNKIQQLLSVIDQGLKDRTDNLQRVRQDQQQISDEIKKFRNKINAQLDHLEQTLVRSLTEKVETIKSNIELISAKLSNSLKCVKELENNMHAVRDYGSDLQTFFGTRKIEEEIENEKEQLKAMFDQGRLNTENVKAKLNDELANAVSKITSFGSVSVDTNQSSLQFQLEEDKAAQILTTTRKSIDDITLTLLRTIDLPGANETPFVTGCAVSPKGDMMFTDHSNTRLIIFNEDGTFKSLISVPGRPTDVTIIDDTTAAVSTLGGIKIIDIMSKQTKQTVTRTTFCFGITYHKGSLLWCELSVGVQSKKLPDGDVCTLIQIKNLGIWSYLASSEDKIFVTNQRINSTVICFTMQGEKQWEYKDISIIKTPFGITTDNNSNVYITSNDSNDVVVMSSDGKRVRRILSEADGLSNPKGLHYDRQRNNLLICNEKRPAFLYHIS